MKKLIEAFKKSPTVDNANRVAAYNRKHPFSVLTISADDRVVVAECIQIVQQA
jgi:hypothetical protein